jgi:hypothetical protein
MCQTLFPTLVNRVHNYHPSANGVLTAHLGKTALAGLWIVSVLSTLATILWIIDAARDKKSSRDTSQGPAPMYLVPKIIRRATGGLMGGIQRYEDTSYDTLRPSKSREPSLGPSRNTSRESLTEKIAHRRSHSHEPLSRTSQDRSDDTESTVLHDSRTLADEKQAVSSRYEPFRHTKIPGSM